MRSNLRLSILFLLIIAGLMVSTTSCKKNKNSNPKPKAYFRIDLPDKAYIPYEANCPYSFEYPEYCIIYPGREKPCWININFPLNEATIYLTYKEIKNNLTTLTEDAREFAYQHTVKAEAINEVSFENDSLHVYGIMYNIKGNVASNIQFYITDSTEHFLRGSLYFNTRPNKDSLTPVINYIREDIIHLMESATWN